MDRDSKKGKKSSSFTIRASKSLVASSLSHGRGEGRKRTILGRFIGPLSKLPTFHGRDRGDDEWTMRSEMFQGSVANWIIEKNALSDDARRRSTYKGAPEGCLTGTKPSNYFILIKEKGDFVAVPVDEWVTFRQSNRRGMDLDEAEAAMKHRRLEAEKQDPVSLRETKSADVLNTVEHGAKKAHMTAEEPDSDEEWKNVKSSAWKVRSQALKHVMDDDDVSDRKQATALDFKDEYKPDDAEDWEHEMAADDDDLDMGDDANEDDQEHGLSPVHGRVAGPSPSVSGDEGEVSDGGMGDSSFRQKMKRVLRANTRGSDEESSEIVSGDEDEDDDDVDELDAMASKDLPMASIPENIDDKKRKGVAASDDAMKKRPRPEDLRNMLQGVPSEDEIRSLLEKEKRMLLADIAAVFKKRLKTPDDRKIFTTRVKGVAMLEPHAEGGKRYLVLRK